MSCEGFSPCSLPQVSDHFKASYTFRSLSNPKFVYIHAWLSIIFFLTGVILYEVLVKTIVIHSYPRTELPLLKYNQLSPCLPLWRCS